MVHSTHNRGTVAMTHQLVAVEFEDDDTFLKSVELFTGPPEGGSSLEVLAPRTVLLWEAQLAVCKRAGLPVRQVRPVRSWQDLPPKEAATLQKNILRAAVRHYTGS